MKTPEESLDLHLAELRREVRNASAPAALESALAAHFRRTHRKGTRPTLWWMPPLALALALAVVSWMIRGPIAPMPKPAAASAPEADPGPFLALRPLERIALEPGTTVVETEFPRALLADWGLPVAPERANESVRAEMLYSADGEALAVRLIH